MVRWSNSWMAQVDGQLAAVTKCNRCYLKRQLASKCQISGWQVSNVISQIVRWSNSWTVEVDGQLTAVTKFNRCYLKRQLASHLCAAGQLAMQPISDLGHPQTLWSSSSEFMKLEELYMSPVSEDFWVLWLARRIEIIHVRSDKRGYGKDNVALTSS